MRNKRVDFFCPVLLQGPGGERERVAGVDHVVDEDGDLRLLSQARELLFPGGAYLVAHVADEDVHFLLLARRVLVRALPVDEGKLDAKLVCNRGDAAR